MKPMCTVVVLRRPGHRWPLILAGNRDEMADRPWRPPGRHWPNQPRVVAGLDELAGGTWMGLNDDGVVAVVLNRRQSLGPKEGRRSRGELPLFALDHTMARAAAMAVAAVDPAAYRTFNLIIADRLEAFWLCSRFDANGAVSVPPVEVYPLPPGVSMITASDRNDTNSPRIRAYLPRFEKAPPPDPDAGTWSAWTALLASRVHDDGAGPQGAMTIGGENGFGTVCSSLVGLGTAPGGRPRAVWMFAAGAPDCAPFEPVALV